VALAIGPTLRHLVICRPVPQTATPLVPTPMPAVDTSGAVRSQLLTTAAAPGGGIATAARGLLAAVTAHGLLLHAAASHRLGRRARGARVLRTRV